MTKRKAHKIAKTFYASCRNPNHHAQHRNALNQTAMIHKIPERKVHAALFMALTGGTWHKG